VIAFENESFVRCGVWLASSAWRVPAPAVIVGPALAAGKPFAALLVRADALPSLDTAAAEALAGAAPPPAQETIDTAAGMVQAIGREDLLRRSVENAHYLNQRLDSLRATCSQIAGIDMAGLAAVIRFAPFFPGARLKRQLCERGILAGLRTPSQLLVLPPLAIRPAEIDAITGSLRAALLGQPAWRQAVCCVSCTVIAAE